MRSVLWCLDAFVQCVTAVPSCTYIIIFVLHNWVLAVYILFIVYDCQRVFCYRIKAVKSFAIEYIAYSVRFTIFQFLFFFLCVLRVLNAYYDTVSIWQIFVIEHHTDTHRNEHIKNSAIWLTSVVSYNLIDPTVCVCVCMC